MFRVDISTGSGVVRLFVSIHNTIHFLPNIWRLGQVKDIKFRKNVTECWKTPRDTTFALSELLRENQKDEG